MLACSLDLWVNVAPVQAGCWSGQKSQKSNGCSIRTCVRITLIAMLEPSVSQSPEKCSHMGLNTNPIHVCEMEFPCCKAQKLERREQNVIGLKPKFFSWTCMKEEWSLLFLNFSSTYRGKKKAQLEWSPLCSSVSLFLLLPGGEGTSLPLVPLGEVSQLAPLQCILPLTAGSLKHLHTCTLLQQKYSSLRCFTSFRNEIRFYCPAENLCLGGMAITLICKLWLTAAIYTWAMQCKRRRPVERCWCWGWKVHTLHFGGFPSELSPVLYLLL